MLNDFGILSEPNVERVMDYVFSIWLNVEMANDYGILNEQNAVTVNDFQFLIDYGYDFDYAIYLSAAIHFDFLNGIFVNHLKVNDYDFWNGWHQKHENLIENGMEFVIQNENYIKKRFVSIIIIRNET